MMFKVKNELFCNTIQFQGEEKERGLDLSGVVDTMLLGAGGKTRKQQEVRYHENAELTNKKRN